LDAGSSDLVGLLPLIGMVVIGVLMVAFTAAAEMSFASVNRAQLRRLVEERGRGGQMAEVLLAEPMRLLSTLMVTKLLGKIMAVAGITLLILREGQQATLIWWLIVMAALLILAQLLPRAWVVGREDRTALTLAPLVRGAALLLTPVTYIMRRIGQGAVPSGTAAESIFLSEDGIRFLLNVSDEQTTIEDEEKEMIASIFEFSDKLVREVMVPRIDVTGVTDDAPMLEALDVILKAGHSRIPVYKDTIDNVIGILYAKDLLRYLRDGRTDVPLHKIVRPAYFIPESKKVDELLQELQQRKVHMAVVVDEYGGTAGLVTIEDLLEEIVGEIQDEFDAEEPTVETVNEHEFLFDARVPLDEVSKLLGVELPSEGGDTLGGFIYSQLGKVPAVGDNITYDSAVFEVLTVAGRRIKQVRANVVIEEPPANGGKSPGRAEAEPGGAGLLAFLSFD
jgi:CBS domain containing-hemolysin-like protein